MLELQELRPQRKRGAHGGETTGPPLASRRRQRTEAGGQVPLLAPPRTLSLPSRHQLPPHRHVMAPMVGGSELPFRMLARRYGTDLCYTPMIYSGPFSQDAAYRAAPENGFQTCPEDRPLVAHFCGNDPEVLLAAARHVVGQVDAIDLNMGCPQRVAYAGHFGSYLLDPKDRELVCSIVKRLSDSLPIPVFCKIRLLDDLEETLKLAKQLEASGASLLAVHARYRGSPTHRRDGPAHLEQVRPIKKALRIPVLANGNVRSWEDVLANLKSTGADGIMSAEGMLDDPCIFGEAVAMRIARQPKVALRSVEKKLRQIDVLRTRQAEGHSLTVDELRKVSSRKALRAERKQSMSVPAGGSLGTATPKDGLEKARLYLDMARKYWMPPASTVVFHCRRMAKVELAQYQLLEEFSALKSVEEVEALLAKAEGHRDGPGPFKVDEGRSQKERELKAQRAYEEECRKKYESRMSRKAQRLGKQLTALLKPTACPGGLLSFSAEPSWLLERDGEEGVAFGPVGGRGGRGS